MNQHVAKAWLNKAIDPDTKHQVLARPHPAIWEDTPCVVATDGSRMHIVRNPPRSLVRRGSRDRWYSERAIKLPMLYEEPETSRTLTVKRGLLTRLYAWREWSLNADAPVEVGATGNGLALWTADGELLNETVMPAIPDIAVRKVQARFLIDALYIFHERDVQVRFVTDSLLLTDGVCTAVIMRLASLIDVTARAALSYEVTP